MGIAGALKLQICCFGSALPCSTYSRDVALAPDSSSVSLDGHLYTFFSQVARSPSTTSPLFSYAACKKRLACVGALFHIPAPVILSPLSAWVRAVPTAVRPQPGASVVVSLSEETRARAVASRQLL